MKATETYQNETVRGLPTAFDLTGDSRWDEEGDLLKLYDLELEKRTAVRSVFTGVKVFGQNQGGERINFGEESGQEEIF